MQAVDEKAQSKIINNLKAEINKTFIPSKAILNLVYAKCLSDYQRQNSNLLYNRTNIANLNDDFLKENTKKPALSNEKNCLLLLLIKIVNNKSHNPRTKIFYERIIRTTF